MTPAGRSGRARGRARRGFLRPLLRRLGARHARRLRLAHLPRRSRHHGARGLELLVQHGFIKDILITIWRVFGGFLLAAAIGIPLGMAMGAYKPVEAFFEPFISFSRYLPASAFIPLLILWAEPARRRSSLVIFVGSFFQIVLMVAVTVGNTRRDLVEAAYTLGASDRASSRALPWPRRPKSPRSRAWCSAGRGPTSSSPS